MEIIEAPLGIQHKLQDSVLFNMFVLWSRTMCLCMCLRCLCVCGEGQGGGGSIFYVLEYLESSQ